MKVNKVLQVCRISPSKTIGGLSERQRAELDLACCAARFPQPLPGKVFVITGPSGVGKGTLIRTLLERMPELELAVSATTREPRPGEERRRRTTTSSTTRSSIAASSRATSSSTPSYSGRRYGTLRSELEKRTADGASVVLEIEVQGARQVERAMPEAVRIFIAPPSEETLRTRLIGRGTDDLEQIERRLQVAKAELAASGEFPHVVHNDRLDDAVADSSSRSCAPLARDPQRARRCRYCPRRRTTRRPG